ncbi:hypothetical protein [Candidatus Poriferisodalis sp.]|uniref:hypothetical protein n=1 Tax=Candidatus Poriferisodalis sp. TaxID=3101277 RepID=UPI003B522223
MTLPADEDDQFSPAGTTVVWAFLLVLGMVALFGLTQWGLLDDVAQSENVAGIAIGTHNAIGIVAIGGWNAIGVVAIGGANSIGAITIGGFNSVGLIAIGGVNATGYITLGGLNAFGAKGASIFRWSPRSLRNGSRFGC